MLQTRRSFLATAALASAGAAFGLPASSALAASRTAVRMSAPGPGTAGAIWKPLIDAGVVKIPPELDLSWILGNPGQVQLQLTAKAVDVSAFGALGVAEIAPRGSDIVIFAPSTNNHGRWIVRGDSPFKSPKDLIGKKIATQPENSDTYRQARLAGLLHGYDLKKDFQVIFGPPTANLALFSRGDVDAVITIEPTATRLIAGGAKEIAKVGDQWQAATNDPAPLLLIGYAGRRDWVEENRVAVDALREVLIDLNRKIKQKPELIAEQHAAYGIPASERAAIELLPSRMVDLYAVDWNKATFANLDRQITESVKAGILPAAPQKHVYLPALNGAG